MANNTRTEIHRYFSQSIGSIGNSMEYITRIMTELLPKDIQTSIVISELSELFDVISMTENVRAIDLYNEVLATGGCSDLGKYAEYLIECYAAYRILGQAQEYILHTKNNF